MKPVFYLFPRLIRPLALFIAVLAITVQTAGHCPAQETVKTIAVLPVNINASKDLAYIRKGVGKMLYTRLSWPDQVWVIPPRALESQMAETRDLDENQMVSHIAAITNSDYVVTGSITQLGGSFSVDTQVFDIQNKRYMAFFEQSDIAADLIDKVDRIAARINKRVFDRDTVTWEAMEKEKQAAINDYRRKNPEHLMNTLAAPREKKEDVGWKIWKYLF